MLGYVGYYRIDWGHIWYGGVLGICFNMVMCVWGMLGYVRICEVTFLDYDKIGYIGVCWGILGYVGVYGQRLKRV